MQSLWPDIRATPLREAPSLAARLGVSRICLKMETERPLGNFKSLGGMLAGITVLMRHTGCLTLEALSAAKTLPALVCASDGNHGLAVACAARRVNGHATIFLPRHVSGARVERIRAQGARIERVSGTYDDAVDMAKRFAEQTGGLLVPDTSDDVDDPTVNLVMAGYGLMTNELVREFAEIHAAPTHVFVQAGVGGLAAAMALGLSRVLAAPGQIVVVEPEAADCVGQALRLKRPLRLGGDLETAADMLSCGEASAPAIEELLKHPVTSIALSEDDLRLGPSALAQMETVKTTASGAAGLAGLIKACRSPELRTRLGLTETSRVLAIITERADPA